MHKNTILSYADDTVVISGHDTWAYAQKKMNKFLDKIANWLAFNKLSLNMNKTVYMTVENKLVCKYNILYQPLYR